MQICVYFLHLFIFFSQLQEENACILFLGKMDVLALLYFVKIWGYMYARKVSVDMNISMDIH